MRIELHRLARKEILTSFDWYFARSPPAAQQFRDQLKLALDQIAEAPFRFAKHSKETRSAPVIKFPYRIIFSIEPDQIFVAAIAHAKRRPNYWSRRLKNR